MTLQDRLALIAGVLCDRLEGASSDRSMSENRDLLQMEDKQAVEIARFLINQNYLAGKKRNAR